MSKLLIPGEYDFTVEKALPKRGGGGQLVLRCVAMPEASPVLLLLQGDMLTDFFEAGLGIPNKLTLTKDDRELLLKSVIRGRVKLSSDGQFNNFIVRSALILIGKLQSASVSKSASASGKEQGGQDA